MVDKDEKALQFIEEVTRDADTVQQNVLAEILTQNAQTEYLKSFNLNEATDRKTFKSKIPMITYEDIQPLIRRIADGDRSPILTAHPISEFLISSGTSGGERKFIPSTKEDIDRILFFSSLSGPIMNMHVKGLDKGKALHFCFTKPEKKTQGGLTAQSITSTIYKHFARLNKLQNAYTSPNEAILCVDMFQSMYTQMLCGLYEREQVVRIGATFANGLLWAIKFLQLNWQQLTHDIKTGSLNPKVTDAPIRECMARVMQPRPDLADFIALECGKENWDGIITRIWPNTKYLDVVVTGSMAQYIPSLDYYSGGLPKVSMRYASSECFIGINLNPMCNPSEVTYTVLPNMAYFEFLPHELDSSGFTHEELVDLVDVEIGKEYEIVITTHAGLYRYRVGDILRVTAFHNSAPQFEFVRRKNVVLSIDVVKTDEVELQAAVGNACQLLHKFNTSVVEYTSHADTEIFPGHYVIYLELLVKDLANSPSDEVLDQCCLAMEESFNSMYRVSRVVNKSIGPLEIRVVKNGTFEELMDFAISRGSSIGQYKVPRCVDFKPIVDLLDLGVVSKHFSPSMPHWTLEPILRE